MRLERFLLAAKTQRLAVSNRSVFLRSTKQEKPEADVHDELAEMIHREADVTTQLDSWGNPVRPPAAAPADHGAEPAA